MNKSNIVFNIQIMPKVIILCWINALPTIQGLMRAEGPKHPYMLGRPLIQPKIITEGIICFLSQSQTSKSISVRVSETWIIRLAVMYFLGLFVLCIYALLKYFHKGMNINFLNTIIFFIDYLSLNKNMFFPKTKFIEY